MLLNCFSKWFYHFDTISITVYECSSCSTSSTILDMVRIFKFSYSNRYIVLSHVVLIFISLMDDDVEYIFNWLFTMCFFGEVYFKIFCSCFTSLCILDTGLLLEKDLKWLSPKLWQLCVFFGRANFINFEVPLIVYVCVCAVLFLLFIFYIRNYGRTQGHRVFLYFL